ncbi:hypothetical protein BaRGS_00027865, partial [Batillaria attramentaria]
TLTNEAEGTGDNVVISSVNGEGASVEPAVSQASRAHSRWLSFLEAFHCFGLWLKNQINGGRCSRTPNQDPACSVTDFEQTTFAPGGVCLKGSLPQASSNLAQRQTVDINVAAETDATLRQPAQESRTNLGTTQSLFPYIQRSSKSAFLGEKSAKESVTVSLVRHHEHPKLRNDIGESGMPDVIVTKFNFGGDDVILKLQRVPHLPVTDSGVYVDPSRMASFMVKQSDFDDFLLDGNLKHNGRQLVMKPAARRRRSVDDDNTHDVSIVTQWIDFGHDYLPSDHATRERNNQDHVGEARQKRQATGITVHTVETVFVVDNSDYRRWQARFPTNTLANLREFYTYTVNNIYSSVNQVNNAVDIKFLVKQLYVVETAANSFSEVLNANTGGGPIEGSDFLDAFRDWIPTQSARGLDQDGDHYMVFTAFDVVLNGGAAVGVARKGEVCTDNSVSVVENSFSPSVANIAAHELGHCLDASHDGEGGCNQFRQFVMTPTFVVPPQYTVAEPQNLFDFSTCSVDSFISYLDGVTCTLPAQTSATNALPSIPRGEIITNRDEQCRYIRDDATSEFCTFGPALNEICSGMLCRIPSSNPNTINCTYVLPFEGTPCGNSL